MSLSPYINRFLSADTIVQSPTNPQNLNRFSYVLNNPLRYVDPTGHMVDNGCSLGCSSISTSNYCATHPTACNQGTGGGGNGGNHGGGNGGPHSDENDSGIPTTKSSGSESQEESPTCPRCILAGVAIFIGLAPSEIALGIGIILLAPEAPIFEPILVVPELIALDLTLIGVELIGQGQHRSAQEVSLDPFPLIPTSDHMFNPDIWK